ncbi:MAG: Gfo/Idh/MocA family oxidoreductase [Tannerella sp.]|jgi:predicted dehydrogenase|nr:Gfo/Idh/MocA family oxidoreductase [Tannerella sp.]
MKKIRVAIIGFGFMGKTHAKNILNSDLMELCAIVDSRIGSANQVSGNMDTGEIPPEKLAGIHKYDSLERCFEEESPDAAFVCVHTLSHCDIAMKALKYGLHVFIEKPFVLKVEEGEALIAEAKRRNRTLYVGHVVRFMPAYVKLNELYGSGVYGKLKFVSATRFSGVPNWGEWDKLRKDFGSSGGALFDLVIHDIDFLRYMLGMPDGIESKTMPGILSNHDYVSAFWRYNDKDVFVKIEGGLNFHSRFPFEATFKASFEKASVVWSSSAGLEMKIADNDRLQTVVLGDANEGYTVEDEEFATRIINHEAPASMAESALDTVRLCHRHIDGAP